MAMPTLALLTLAVLTHQLNDEELVPVADALLAHYTALPEARADLTRTLSPQPQPNPNPNP